MPRPLPDEEVADVKRITKRFHYCANAADAGMLHALGDINCKVSEGAAAAGRQPWLPKGREEQKHFTVAWEAAACSSAA